jgi:hypothetical protein
VHITIINTVELDVVGCFLNVLSVLIRGHWRPPAAGDGAEPAQPRSRWQREADLADHSPNELIGLLDRVRAGSHLHNCVGADIAR